MKYEDSRTSYRNPVSQSLLINELSQERERERERGRLLCNFRRLSSLPPR